MTEQQLQGLLRSLFNLASGYALAKGFSADQWSAITNDALIAAGALFGLSTAAWTWWSHKPATLVATVNKLESQGKV